MNKYILPSLIMICVVVMSCGRNISEEQRRAEEKVLKDISSYDSDPSSCRVINTVVTNVEYAATYDTVYHVANAHFPIVWSIVADYFDIDSLGVQRRDYPAHTIYEVEYEGTSKYGKYKSKREVVICNGELYYPGSKFRSNCWDHPVMDHVIPCHRRYAPDGGAGAEIGKWQTDSRLGIEFCLGDFKTYK